MTALERGDQPIPKVPLIEGQAAFGVRPERPVAGSPRSPPNWIGDGTTSAIWAHAFVVTDGDGNHASCF